ncbi:MAG: M48 family metallopeptidase [Gammaproteobacteria bacterium]|nr:M48 family metallopeptidase [Gammaproteobacteria bacterium]
MKYENPEIPEGINTTDESPLKEFALLSSGILLITSAVIFLIVLLTEYTAQFIPFEFEQHLVSPIVEEYTQPSTPTQQYLQRLADKIVLAQKLPPEIKIKIHYVKEDRINAFATLGGHIVIYRGLLEKLPNETSLSMLLGHEIAHIKYRHPIKSLSSGLILQLLWIMVSSNNDVTGILDITLLTSLSFSRDNETEADEEGLHSVYNVYQGVNGATDLFKALQEAQADSSFTPLEYFSTHPDTNSRIIHLDELAEKNAWPTDKPPVEKIDLKFN